jgi:ABC-2 type transport system permease protein
VRTLYRTFLSTQVTKGRLAGLGALGVLAVLLGVAVGAGDAADPLGDGIGLVAAFGLSLFVPVTTLVFASAVLGEPNEDGTLVYLWLRPVARWRLVAAALAAALTVAVPVVVLPLTLAAALTGAGAGLVAATLASTTLATVAYAGLFTWLGLRVRRALIWGLAYILVWEGFVARAGGGASLLAVRTHARSLLARLASGAPDLVEVSLATSVVLPLIAAATAAALTIRRLHRQDVA